MKKEYIIYPLVVIAIAVFSYYAFHFARKINYSLAYEDMVIQTTQETICKSVKKEHLSINCSEILK